jgi:hypothetical protein
VPNMTDGIDTDNGDHNTGHDVGFD